MKRMRRATTKICFIHALHMATTRNKIIYYINYLHNSSSSSFSSFSARDPESKRKATIKDFFIARMKLFNSSLHAAYSSDLPPNRCQPGSTLKANKLLRVNHICMLLNSPEVKLSSWVRLHRRAFDGNDVKYISPSLLVCSLLLPCSYQHEINIYENLLCKHYQT